MTRKELKEVLGDKLNERQIARLCLKKEVARAVRHTKKSFRRTFVGAFLIKYPTGARVLDYMCEALGKEYVEWDDMTKVNLHVISEKINGSVSPNSAATYIHMIMATLNDFSEEGVLPLKSVKNAMKTKNVPSQHVALTMDEINRFEAYEPKSPRERDVKCLFMRACYTGARCSDVLRMNEGTIVGGYISYVSKKTKIEVMQPLHQKLRKYLEYDIRGEYNARQINDTIKSICKTIGIREKVSLFYEGKLQNGEKWQFCSMHTARRSFCTVLAQLGVSVETIRTMAGHTNTAMTDRYICLDGRKPGKDAMHFFNG